MKGLIVFLMLTDFSLTVYANAEKEIVLIKPTISGERIDSESDVFADPVDDQIFEREKAARRAQLGTSEASGSYARSKTEAEELDKHEFRQGYERQLRSFGVSP